MPLLCPLTPADLLLPLPLLAAPRPVQEKDKNPMREIRVEKLILNICVGESGDRLTFASRVLEQLVRHLSDALIGRRPSRFPRPPLSLSSSSLPAIRCLALRATDGPEARSRQGCVGVSGGLHGTGIWRVPLSPAVRCRHVCCRVFAPACCGLLVQHATLCDSSPSDAMRPSLCTSRCEAPRRWTCWSAVCV